MPEKLKIKLKLIFGHNLYKGLKGIYLRILSLPFAGNLNMLARIYKTDKWGKHNYTEHYAVYLRKFRCKRIKLFEIGAGGYHFNDIGGNSLRMWKRYFPFGKIFSIDIYDKSIFEERRIKIFKGDQADEVFLDKIFVTIGEPDIIIDDGSHINEHVLKTFNLLFPRLKTGGIYAIEDTCTSYWPDYGGSSDDLEKPSTIMNYFKKLTDCLNHKEFVNREYVPTYFDRNICSIQFYHNLILIFKGLNDERSCVDPNHPEHILIDKLPG